MKFTAYRLFMIAVGSLVSSIGVNTFLLPHHMLSGGATGVAMIVYFLLHWPVGVMVLLLNIPLFYAAYRYMDREYVLVSAYGIGVLSAALMLTQPLAQLQAVDDTMLAAVFGGVLSGLGGGLVFRVNGGTGGTDIVAAILKRYWAFNVGAVGFSINLVIISISSLLFGLKPAMFTLIAMYISGRVTDNVVEGINRKKTITIISEHSEEIAQAILSQLGRGVTFLSGSGAYTRQDKQVVYAVVTAMELAKIKFIVEGIDPLAFMIVSEAAEVLGRGFTYRTKSKRNGPL